MRQVPKSRTINEHVEYSRTQMSNYNLNTHWTGTMAQFTERSPRSRLKHTEQVKNTRMINEHVERSRTQYPFMIKHSLNRDDGTIHWMRSGDEQSSRDKYSSGDKQSSEKEQKDERTHQTSHQTEQNWNAQLRSRSRSCDQWRNVLMTFMTLEYNGCLDLQVNFELNSRFAVRY